MDKDYDLLFLIVLNNFSFLLFYLHLYPLLRKENWKYFLLLTFAFSNPFGIYPFGSLIYDLEVFLVILRFIFQYSEAAFYEN